MPELARSAVVDAWLRGDRAPLATLPFAFTLE
jgi:hypothetical protein